MIWFALFIYLQIAAGVAIQAWHMDDRRGDAMPRLAYAAFGAFWPVTLGLLLAMVTDEAVDD